MIFFNRRAGLSLPELIAVDDVDLMAGILTVPRALIADKFKAPKERSRIRTVELIAPPLELMTAILADAKQSKPDHITVVQRDNITKKHERVHFLFRSPTSGLLWSGKTVSSWFARTLRRQEFVTAERTRLRHTFASQSLSSYVLRPD